ncbi:alpha/beta hydrolase family protein [Chryseobacterium sp. MFBS3-17]|uniref:alpha/beta hydrolase family protein n=1 Tax=Chryseobacterium sp. MFBS3-17 TaxID=2886689 RepID=UPI001D0EECCE|nr:alpha/beta fold hydrolase [Chryseobacterium sp. MFBS3-17]MCC2591623.1 alpha/beta fold hydrolase [Chryseobacterium sp. MFBS3-17]
MPIITQKNILIQNPDTRDFLADACFPESEKPLPLIVFAHGFKGYKDWGAWNLMAERFAEAGFFFVKFNFSYNGTTIDRPAEFADTEAFGLNNFTKEMSDFKRVLSHFLKRKEVDSERVSIIGHSRGGGIAVVQAFEDERVKNVITYAGVSNFGYRFPTGHKLERWKEEGVMFSENTRTKQQLPLYFQYYEDYKANENRFNIQYAAQHLKKPYLVVQGTADEAVAEKEGLLLHEWCKSSELFLLPDVNHVFGGREPWTADAMPQDLSRIVEKTIDFLKNK